LKQFCCMMDSMTDDELDSVKPIDVKSGRIERIARGSGTQVPEVHQLLDEHKRFSKMVGKMGKMSKGKGSELQQLQRNPQQMMRQLQGCMDPRMMQQIGGADNLMSMMKEMGKLDPKSMQGLF